MSHAAYNIQWADAQTDINDLLEIEVPAEPAKPEHDRIAVFQHLAVMYIKYIQIFRKLEECYDQVSAICCFHFLIWILPQSP